MCARVFVLALTGCLLIAATSCRRSYEVQPPPEPTVRKNEERERLVAAQRSQYRELQGKLASMKLQIENHIRVYELAMDAQDPLNRREDPIALARIVESARTLHEESASALAVDREVFRYVKGSARALRNYNSFAKSILDKYEHPQSEEMHVEASATPALDGPDGAAPAVSDLP